MLFLISCIEEQKNNSENKSNTASASILKEMVLEKNEDNWGGDIVLHIQRTKKISAEITAYKVVSLYKGTPVGFDMIVKQPVKKDMFVNKGISFLALKDTSNNFLAALAEIYGVKFSNTGFVDSLTITYADLEAGTDLNKPGNWIAAQKKLFFETDEDTSELLLNIDEAEGTISLPEKDKDYREGIIRSLSKKLK